MKTNIAAANWPIRITVRPEPCTSHKTPGIGCQYRHTAMNNRLATQVYNDRSSAGGETRVTQALAGVRARIE
jgi:hypothetical protein